MEILIINDSEILYKKCPKCGGTLFLHVRPDEMKTGDYEGTYQCGYTFTKTELLHCSYNKKWSLKGSRIMVQFTDKFCNDIVPLEVIFNRGYVRKSPNNSRDFRRAYRANKMSNKKIRQKGKCPICAAHQLQPWAYESMGDGTTKVIMWRCRSCRHTFNVE